MADSPDKQTAAKTEPAAVSPSSETHNEIVTTGAKPSTSSSFERSQSTKRKLSTTGHSLYCLLDVPKTATEEEIVKAYKMMALIYHPDKNPDNPLATKKFKEINNAKTILTDPQRREVYDKYGSAGLKIAEQIGVDNVHAYFLAKSGWFQVFMLCFGLSTCCFCCCCMCCCCCCCNFCFGCGTMCKDEPKKEGDEEVPLENVAEDGECSKPVTTQPSASAPPSPEKKADNV